MQFLEKIVKAWEQGQQVAMQIVDPACQDDEEASNCIDGYPCGKNKPDVGIDLDHCGISDPPVDLAHYNAYDSPDINDPPVNLDYCNPPVNLDHHVICDPAVNLDHHDTNDPPIDFEQHDICDPAVNLDHHDTNHPPIDLEQHDICDPAINLDHHVTNDPPIDLEQHDINDPSGSLHDHDINDPSAKLDNHIINDSPDLKSIKLPPEIRKRGRPKGADLTVIGLPKKKKCTDSDRLVKFLKKSIEERERQILSWMLPDHLVTKALQSGLLEYNEVNCNSLEFSPSLLDENLNLASLQKFFTKEAWVKMTDLIAKLEKDPKWKCATCHKDVS